jgi:hypothetical protein
MQFSKSPPLFLPCTLVDNDGNHSYEKDFRKFSLSSYRGGGGSGKGVAGEGSDPETAVSAVDQVRTQRLSCVLLQRCTPIGVHALSKCDYVYCVCCKYKSVVELTE